MHTLTSLSAWKALAEHYALVRETHMRDLFAEDPDRFHHFSLKLDDFLVDFSKNRIDHHHRSFARAKVDKLG